MIAHKGDERLLFFNFLSFSFKLTVACWDRWREHPIRTTCHWISPIEGKTILTAVAARVTFMYCISRCTSSNLKPRRYSWMLAIHSFEKMVQDWKIGLLKTGYLSMMPVCFVFVVWEFVTKYFQVYYPIGVSLLYANCYGNGIKINTTYIYLSMSKDKTSILIKF